jgi:glycosyltransferase involved in cell wall biosynthesis
MERSRLLFVGGQFERKGGDQVLAAVERLRGQGGLPITLTVVGPRSWPTSTAPPPWVRFLGAVPPAVVAQLFYDHDLFVMPSRFEAYGIVLLEAQAAGLPCVARRAFAMSELVPEGRGGMLIEPDDGPEELATTIATALDDDSLYKHIGCRATEVRTTNSWDAVADRMVRSIQRRLAA